MDRSHAGRLVPPGGEMGPMANQESMENQADQPQEQPAAGAEEKAPEAPKAEARPAKGKGGDKGARQDKGAKKDKGEAKGEKPKKEKVPAPRPRLLVRYEQEIGPALRQDLSKSNPMAVPRVEKVVVSMGLGKAIQEGGAKSAETKRFQDAISQLTAVVGQRPAITRARKSVAQFKVRSGWPTGLKVTLRGARMWEFLDRLINLAAPRIRDFRGLDPKGFDGRGNYNMGVTEQSVFPEIDASQIAYQQGMNVTICTTGKNDTEAFELLRRMGMPFRS